MICGSSSDPDERRRVPASITHVSEEKETSARGRLVGRPSCRYPFPFWLGLWLFGHLCVGNPDVWDRGLVTVLGLSFVACLPQLRQLPVHRSVPELQVISRRAFLRARDLQLQAL